MTRQIRSRRAGGSADEARLRPLYARVLRLRHLNPSGFLCFAFLEGAVALGILLALAELVSWWGVLLLPVTVALMVKLNDVIAGVVSPAPRRSARPGAVGRSTPRVAAAAPATRSGARSAHVSGQGSAGWSRTPGVVGQTGGTAGGYSGVAGAPGRRADTDRARPDHNRVAGARGGLGDTGGSQARYDGDTGGNVAYDDGSPGPARSGYGGGSADRAVFQEAETSPWQAAETPPRRGAVIGQDVASPADPAASLNAQPGVRSWDRAEHLDSAHQKARQSASRRYE